MYKLKASIIFVSFYLTYFSQYIKLFDFASQQPGTNPTDSFFSDDEFLYGLTYYSDGSLSSNGNIFKINSDATTHSNIYSFQGSSNSDGANPVGTLISDGQFLYGLTFKGGINNKGTIFKINKNGDYFKLFDFDGLNGSLPSGSLTLDSLTSYLYGTTYSGGLNDKGCVFKIKTDGSEYSKLLDFDGTNNGANPKGKLILDGNHLYGMTRVGGAEGFGTIFKLSTAGTNYIKIHDFNNLNGNYPDGSLTTDGLNLYGVTFYGGINSKGSIFKVSKDGTNFQTIYHFGENSNDGSNPVGALLLDGNNLYGMTYGGGINDWGSIFQIKIDGSNYSKLHDFDGINGGNGFGSLLPKDGFLYGMTHYGGLQDRGVIFKLKFNSVAKLDKMNHTSQKVNVFPNPTQHICMIEIDNKLCNSYEICLEDISGRKIYAEKWVLLSGLYQKMLDLSKYPTGTYQLKIIGGSIYYCQKIIKQ